MGDHLEFAHFTADLSQLALQYRDGDSYLH